MEQNTSPAWSTKNINWKSIGLYMASILATGLLANLVGLSEMLADFLDPTVVTLIISFLGIFLKKFVEYKPQ